MAVVMSVPDEYFSDDDDICLAAASFVCGRLEEHLIENGHTIADWTRGGCVEDWGVYYESQRGGETFHYQISFFPYLTDDGESQMIVQYHLKIPFLKRLFTKPRRLGADHSMHEAMRKFGRLFKSSRMLTQSEFDKQH